MPSPVNPNQGRANYPPPYPYQGQSQPSLPPQPAAAPSGTNVPAPPSAKARYFIPLNDPTYVSPSVSIPGHSQPGLFRSLWIRPQEKIYENLEADEIVLMMIARHWVTQIPKFILGGFLAIAPLIAVPIVLLATDSSFISRLSFIVAWFWYTYVLLYWIGVFVRWKSDVYLITTERIIDFETDLLLLKSAKDVELDYIYQVDHSKPQGLIKGGIHYGDVYAKFPGESGGVEMKKIPEPEKIALAIGEIAELARRESGGGHNLNPTPRPQ